MTQDSVASSAEAARISQISFEDALRALEGVVRQLESGEVPLDESISLYETGEKLAWRLSDPARCRPARIERRGGGRWLADRASARPGLNRMNPARMALSPRGPDKNDAGEAQWLL
jgi:exodeoxyribonuclease VII small subunit